MSLVSYGASDESDTSDGDEGKVNSNTQAFKNAKQTKITTGYISDEDDFDAVVGSSSSVTFTSSTSMLAPITPANVFDSTDLLSSSTDDNVNSTSLTTLRDLPAPQSQKHITETEEDLEDEVRPKAVEIASAPKPPTKKTKQPVKITIPSLVEEPINEEKDSEKKAAPSTVKSGLFSLLPAPVNAAKKEVNRPLIPHTLTKKPASAKVKTTSNSGDKLSSSSKVKKVSEIASTREISSKRMTPFNALTGYDSDSDDDDDQGSTTNFFSLTSPSAVKTQDSTSEVTTKRLQSEEVSSSESELNSGDPHQNVQEKTEELSENGDEEDLVEEKDIIPEPGAINDAPLDFRSVNRLSSWSSSSYGFLGPVGLTGPVSQPRSLESSSFLPSSSGYSQVSPEVSSEMNDEDIETVADEDLKKFMSDKEFQKLQGKRKRGLEEAISFVDANVDDYVDPSEVTKYLTEETEYVSHKSKDNLPTAQQRRKKQITYLAYQAKERELELKNTWAQNRMTKKQTQSKYGF